LSCYSVLRVNYIIFARHVLMVEIANRIHSNYNKFRRLMKVIRFFHGVVQCSAEIFVRIFACVKTDKRIFVVML